MFEEQDESEKHRWSIKVTYNSPAIDKWNRSKHYQNICSDEMKHSESSFGMDHINFVRISE